MEIKKGINLIHHELREKLVEDINLTGLPAVNIRSILGELYEMALQNERGEVQKEQQAYENALAQADAEKESDAQEESEVR